MEDVLMLEGVQESLELMTTAYKDSIRVLADTTAAVQNSQGDTVLRHEDLQRAFDASQVDPQADMGLAQENFALSTDPDNMSEFFANWLGGDQPAAQLLNMDYI
ncbi:MAG: hypothetical protein MMC23_008143 [Stictis urceolatum]|nr:hypothetical protein [Stictis urceolata]